MKSWKRGGLAVLGAVALGAGASVPAQSPGDPVWLSDYEAARAAARQSGKPLFVAFR